MILNIIGIKWCLTMAWLRVGQDDRTGTPAIRSPKLKGGGGESESFSQFRFWRRDEGAMSAGVNNMSNVKGKSNQHHECPLRGFRQRRRHQNSWRRVLGPSTAAFLLRPYKQMCHEWQLHLFPVVSTAPWCIDGEACSFCTNVIVGNVV